MHRISKYEPILAIALIILVSSLAYLPLVARLGLYREDWYLLWTGMLGSPQDFIPLFASDRPFVGYLFRFFYPLLGDTILNWHLNAFLLRLVGVLSFFWMLRLLWPRRRFAATAAALLFAVYPGYLQQYNAVNKTFWLTALAVALLSLALTVLATRRKKTWQVVLVTLGALFCTLLYPFIIEFYIGFEAVRLLLIWYALQQQDPKAWWPGWVRAVKWFLPYLAAVSAFLFWRVFLFESTRPTTDLGSLLLDYRAQPLQMLLRLVVVTVVDVYETVVAAWFVPTYQLLFDAGPRQVLLAGFIAVLALIPLIAYYRGLRSSPAVAADPDTTERRSLDFMWIGVLWVVVTLLPMIAAGREVNFDRAIRADHYTIQAAAGVGLLVVGMFYYALRARPDVRFILLAFLIALGVFTHVRNAETWAENWALQKSVWWQLVWRAPAIKNGTLLFVDMPPGHGFSEGYEAWAPASLIYAPNPDAPPVTAELLNHEFAFMLMDGTPKHKTHRSIWVRRNFDKPLLLSMPAPAGCLNVIDGSHYALSPLDSGLVHLLAPYSQINRIEPDAPAARPPASIFGPEPDHGWCFYYQKAMLARQDAEWPAAAALGDEAQRLGLRPAYAVEWVPFYEAYVNTGQLEKSQQLAAAIQTEPGPVEDLCRRWRADPPQAAGYDAEQVLSGLCQ